MTRRVLVIGLGKRVRESALPSLHRAEGLEVAGLLARSARQETIDGRAYAVRSLDADLGALLPTAELVYIAVGKQAVPKVLAALARHELARVELLIETPVLVLKQFRHRALLRGFRAVSVAEDCSELPWLAPARALARELGALREARFERAAYAYHGIATAKALFGAARVESARRRRRADGLHERRIELAGGARARIAEPRDYAQGWLELEYERGRAAEGGHGAAGALPIVAELAGGRLRGLRMGPERVELDDAEAALCWKSEAAASLTARMEDMKRVGFLRLWRKLARGERAWPLEHGLEDMLVDGLLERVGWYGLPGLLSPNAACGAALYGLASRLAR